ncbi:MAG: ferredoxin--NADP reductase, partial [Herminiimonas sp.]|nr:ferredoxin--NADP reductase [Herminiimonas sp.]
GAVVWRAYSMISTPAEAELEFYSVLVPGGLFTSALTTALPGDRILIEKQVYGFMTADRFEEGDTLWMLATGTGLGPFISMLRSPEVWQQFRNLVVVHGVRHQSEFAYQDELFALRDYPPPAAINPGRLQIVQASTRDIEIAGSRLSGRITTLLESGTLEKVTGLLITVESSRFMLCGNPAMIEETRRLLHARGMRPCRRALPGQFLTENYW